MLPYRERIHRCVLPTSVAHVSATEVRERCKAGHPLDDLIPAAVARYIAAHRLYLD
jgi:nicotinic acid mononucleotide adenylyltransferase